MPTIFPSLFTYCFFECIPKFFPHGWCWPSYLTMNPVNRDVAPFYPVPWHRIDFLYTNLLHSLQYVVLANRNFQYASLNSIVASLTLFPVVEDRLVLVLFQRNSVGNVLEKNGLLWWSHWVLPKDCVKGKE